jgi:hypothetical protein
MVSTITRSLMLQTQNKITSRENADDHQYSLSLTLRSFFKLVIGFIFETHFNSHQPLREKAEIVAYENRNFLSDIVHLLQTYLLPLTNFILRSSKLSLRDEFNFSISFSEAPLEPG